MDQRMMTEIEEEDEEEVDIAQVPKEEDVSGEKESEEDTAGQSVADYVNKELEDIHEGKWNRSIQKFICTYVRQGRS